MEGLAAQWMVLVCGLVVARPLSPQLRKFAFLSTLTPISLMAGYFSNHSYQHSRFIATSQPISSATTTQSHTPAPTRSRAPSSKHFSTSLTEERSLSKEKLKFSSSGSSSNGTAGVHPLRNTYVRTPLRRVKNPSVVTDFLYMVLIS